MAIKLLKNIGKNKRMKHRKLQQRISAVQLLINHQTMGSSNVMAGRTAQA
jgi:hypothetical protein